MKDAKPSLDAVSISNKIVLMMRLRSRARTFGVFALKQVAFACRGDGVWMVQVALNHGHHHYQFLIDGKPILGPAAWRC